MGDLNERFIGLSYRFWFQFYLACDIFIYFIFFKNAKLHKNGQITTNFTNENYGVQFSAH